MTLNRIPTRTAIIGAVLLFVVVPLALQPFRPWFVSLPLPEPTLWQSLGMFIGQFLVGGLAVYAYNQRQRIKELEREVERQKYTVADD